MLVVADWGSPRELVDLRSREGPILSKQESNHAVVADWGTPRGLVDLRSREGPILSKHALTLLSNGLIVVDVSQRVVGDCLEKECTLDSSSRAATKVPYTESFVDDCIMYQAFTLKEEEGKVHF